MGKWTKIALVCALTGCMTLPTLSASAASSEIVTPATGYASAEDVVYATGTLTVGGKSKECIKNWGARGEDCTFLSIYATNFYEGNARYGTISQNEGGTSQSDAPSSALYTALADIMIDRHDHESGYQETRYWYGYTDCVGNDDAKFSSFYSGTLYDSTWIGGNSTPWNREHTWPKSKGLGGQDENDIMMLRPTISSENSDRQNKAYGESSGYYDPDISVRGDCARILLYTYTRWGNTANMWKADGVIESVEILLKWMEEDPVDTWEMGRNDVVQSITGTRNIFVDYPEYAWLLFGEEIPSDMVTPSGIAMGADYSNIDSEDDSNVDSVDDPNVDGAEENGESSGGESSEGDGAVTSFFSGCQSSVGGIATAISLAMASAFVCKRRSK